MRWIPNWLAKRYSLLYLNRGDLAFDFEEAKRIFNLEDKRVVSAIVSQLRNRGVLVSWRDPVDPRRKFFKLIPPESLVIAFGIQNSTKDKTLFAKLRAASKHHDYVVGGAYAAFQHHHYSTPGKINIHVEKKDLETWVALLTDKPTAIAIDAIPTEKTGTRTVHLHSNLTNELRNESTVINGIRYRTPEPLVIEGLKREDQLSLTDAIAILITKGNDLNSEKTLRLAEREGATRKLGCLLEIINYEAEREIFPKREIEEIETRTNTSYPLAFPEQAETKPFAEEEKAHYREIGKKWNMKIHLNKAFISKIVTDLAR